MMTVQQFIDKAAAQKQDISHFNVYALAPEQMQMHLDGDCICCGGQAPAEGIWDMDCDEEGRVFGTCTGYKQELFCEGCEMFIPADALLRHGAISQHEYNKRMGIANDEDDDLPF
jgi:hypothetical protein